jgi:hypothetical protein
VLGFGGASLVIGHCRTIRRAIDSNNIYSVARGAKTTTA